MKTDIQLEIVSHFHAFESHHDFGDFSVRVFHAGEGKNHFFGETGKLVLVIA
jgi:hypothetical protein